MLPPLAAHQADALGAVVGEPAAQGDDTVAAFGLEQGQPGLHVGDRGIGLGAVEDHGRDALLQQKAGHLLHHADGDQHLVGDDEGLAEAARLDHLDRFLEAAGAEEVDGRDIEGSGHGATFQKGPDRIERAGGLKDFR